MSAVAGVFTAFTTVNSRSVARIVIEVPIEQADAALAALGGFPKPAESRWVGIAPLVAEPATAVPQPPPEPVPEPPATVTRLHERQPWSTLSRAQQAGIRCGDAEFRRFMNVADPGECAAEIRIHCRVRSRAEIDDRGAAAAAWDELDGRFREWKAQQETERRYADARR